MLTKQDYDGHHHSVAYERTSGGVLSDFTPRTDNQAVSWLLNTRDINHFLSRWLDEIEDFLYDVEHVPGRLNPADPSTSSCFPDRDPCTARPDTAVDPSPGPAAATDRRTPLQRPLLLRSPPADPLLLLVGRLGPRRRAPFQRQLLLLSPPSDPLRLRFGRLGPRRRVPLRRLLRRRSPPSNPLLLLFGRHSRGRRASKTPSPSWQVHRCDWSWAVATSGTITLSPNPVQPERHFLSPCFVTTWSLKLLTDPFFAKLAPSSRALQPLWAAPSTAVVTRWRLPRNARQAAPSSFAEAHSAAEGRGKWTGCVCLAGVEVRGTGRSGRLRASILQECHDTPLGGHFGRHKSAALIRRLANWPEQTRDVDAYVLSCKVCQCTKADHVGPRGLLHPLPLPSRMGCVIDWLLSLRSLHMMASGFDQVQVHVNHLSGKVHHNG